MRDYLLYINMGSGVTLQLTAQLELKHYSMEEINSRVEKIARDLGGTFLYMEAKDPS